MFPALADGSFTTETIRLDRLEFPRETGLILRCAGKAGNPFQTTQANRLSCCDREGRRGSEEAVPGESNDALPLATRIET